MAEKESFYYRTGKRILDLVLLILVFPFLLPLFAVIAWRVKRELGSPILFRQQRPGLNGQIFTLYKFRTMTDERDEQGNLLPDDRRVTPIGRLLRRKSLDELPELINVLKGEMSLVGPRPLLVRYLPYYLEEERKRFLLRPGLTGWAQINGRNNLPWDERLALDTWYVDHLSLWLDLKILFMTVMRVIRSEGVQVAPNLTMLDLDEERRQLQLSR